MHLQTQLGTWLHQILGTLQEKISTRVGKYKNFEMHNYQSPYISPESPLREAVDKCISKR